MKITVGLHSQRLLDIPWLESKVLPNGKCPHFDPSFGEVEVCYGNFNWEMDSFFKQVGDLQSTMVRHGINEEDTKILVDTLKYNVPMLKVLN